MTTPLIRKGFISCRQLPVGLSIGYVGLYPRGVLNDIETILLILI